MTLTLASYLFALQGVAAPTNYYVIRVVDEQTGRGVPLVELKTVHQVRYYTDSNGIVAFHEPGLMDQDVFFHVSSHGYEYPKDGFGFRGKSLRTKPGGSATLHIKRVNIAQRLYRVTGAGIYRDSVLVGEPVPSKQPVLNGLVLGSDSVVNAVYRGKIYWFWGDTNRSAYPLGNFHVPGATSNLPGSGGLSPDVGIDLDYFVTEKGFAKETAKLPGSGPTWLNGLIVLKDGGNVRMFAPYMKVKPPLTIYERGICTFNDDRAVFETVTQFAGNAPFHPGGHPLLHAEGGEEHVYFADPYPLLRVRATAEALADLSQYEAFTCLKRGSLLEAPEFDRDEASRLRYSWKPDTPIIGPKEQAKLIKSGAIKASEALLQTKDRKTGKTVQAHSGSAYWNDYRKRFVMIFVESFGTSALGEVWYAEAPSLTGPWESAVKIVTHNNYSYYNPKQHPMFDAERGKTIYFEGTYTHTFSGNDNATPWYDYNQVLYKLDLSDPRLHE